MHSEINKKSAKKGRAWWKTLLLVLVLLLILIPIILYFLIQIPSVQNKLVDYAAQKLSEKTEMDIQVGDVQLEVFGTEGLQLKNVSVLDPIHQDTIISLGSLSTSLTQNLRSLFNGGLYTDVLEIKDVHVANRVYQGEKTSALLKMFQQQNAYEEEDPDAKPFEFEINTLLVENLYYEELNENNGSKNIYSIKQGKILIDTIDPANNHIVLDELILDAPEVVIDLFAQAIESESELDIVLEETKKPFEFNFAVKKFRVSEGIFQYTDGSQVSAFDFDIPIFDKNNFKVQNLNIEMDAFTASDSLGYFGQLKKLNFVTQEGKSLDHFASDLAFTKKGITLDKLAFRTGNSNVSNKLSLKYRNFDAFLDFNNKVILDGQFENAYLAINELVYFIPQLYESAFFKQNYKEKMYLDGRIRGKINNLRGQDLSINLADKIRLEGNIDTRDITSADDMLINLNLKKLNTSMGDLKKLIPGFNPPENYDKLGKLDFSGRFDGFLYDFVAYGELGTDLGAAKLDMRLDFKDGRDGAKYSGELFLNDFDLRTWSDNPDFDKVSLFTKVSEGKGLRTANAVGDIDAAVESFSYKGYTYKDFKMNGVLNENKFNGDFLIQNDDLDLNFNGYVERQGEKFITDFTAEINDLDFQKINLTKEQVAVKGNINLQLEGSSVNDFIGNGELGDFVLLYKDSLYVFDTLYVDSAPGKEANRNVIVSSEAFALSLDGDFDLRKLPELVQWQMSKNYPYYAERLNIPKQVNLSREQDFSFKFNIKDSRNYLNLLGLPNTSVKNMLAFGSIDSGNEFIEMESVFGSIQTKDNAVNGVSFDVLNRGSENKLHLTLDSLYAGKKLFDPIDIEMQMEGDIMQFSLDTENLGDSLDLVHITGELAPHEDGMQLKFNNEEWRMFSADWDFEKGNQIIIGKNFIEIEDFILTDGDRRIVLEDYKNTGLIGYIENFDFKMIDGIIDWDKVSFTGVGDVIVHVYDIFTEPKGKLNMKVPNFYLDDQNYGNLSIEAFNKDTIVNATIDIQNENHIIKATGNYDITKKEVDAVVRGKGFQLDFFEFIIEDGISETQGYADVDVDVFGPIDDLKLSGEGVVHDGGVRIDYLGNFIRFNNQTIGITEKFIDLTGVQIMDTQGNTGIFTGGMTHDLLEDFRLSLNAYSRNFIGLNTTKKDNPLYYGLGIGEINVDFKGGFSVTDITVDAISGPGTVINVPIEEYHEGYQESFFTFVNKKDLLRATDDETYDDEDEFKIEGVDIEMNITVTEDAEVNIIFNENLNDIIQSKGEGNVRVNIKRNGDFDAFGEYEILEGEYLFTSLGIVAKPFTVKRGGRIQWTGDPYDATLDIDASYTDLSTPLTVFLSEFLDQASPAVQTEARKKTDVDLSMHIGGTLYEPEVSFDFDFPELTGETRAYAESKLNALRQNESEINNQVVALIVLNTFLPTNTSISGTGYTSDEIFSSSYNTLSEFVSNQLSFIVNDGLEALLAENGFVSGVDFNMGFSKNAGVFGLTGNNELAPDEIGLNPTLRFLDDKWELDLDGSYVRRSSFDQLNNYFIGDFSIGYFLTDDKRLKLRAYGKYDVDEIQAGNGREQKYGVGISYRKEFGALVERRRTLLQILKDQQASKKSK